jgi:hypothetical protein
MRAKPYAYIVVWLQALIFLYAAFVPDAASSSYPEIQNISRYEYGAAMAFYLLAAAIWYSLPRLVDRNNLLFFSGFSLALAGVGFLLTPVPSFGIACALLAISARYKSFWHTRAVRITVDEESLM